MYYVYIYYFNEYNNILVELRAFDYTMSYHFYIKNTDFSLGYRKNILHQNLSAFIIKHSLYFNIL